MKRFLSLTICANVVLLISSGCYNDNLEDLYPAGSGGCQTDTVTFNGTIRPIISQSCAFAGCHDAATSAFGIDLSTYSGVQTIALNGKLEGTTMHSTGFFPMPKNAAKLDDCKLSQIRKWVADGAPNN